MILFSKTHSSYNKSILKSDRYQFFIQKPLHSIVCSRKKSPNHLICYIIARGQNLNPFRVCGHGIPHPQITPDCTNLDTFVSQCRSGNASETRAT